MESNRILYLIPARGGSKGVPRKNIREIDGLPLVAYKIIAAQRSKYPGRIVVSTDDEEIARISQKIGGVQRTFLFLCALQSLQLTKQAA